MKKIAFCFYGQPRQIELGKEFYKDIVEKYKDNFNFDVFIHTWFDKDKEYYEASDYRSIDKNELKIDKNIIEKINEYLKPKKFEYEKPINFDLTKYQDSTMYKMSKEFIIKNLNNNISNIYSKFRIGDIFEKYCLSNNVEYDIIITLRFDVKYKLKLDLNNLILDKIYSRFTYNSYFYVTDHIVIFTNNNLFYKYSKIYLNLNKIINNEELKNKSLSLFGCFSMNCESLVTSNLILYFNYINDIVILTEDIPNFK